MLITMIPCKFGALVWFISQIFRRARFLLKTWLQDFPGGAWLRVCLPMQGVFPGGSGGKEYTCSVGDLGSIPGSGRSPGEGKGYLLQYSGLENSMHGVAKVRHDWATFTFSNTRDAVSSPGRETKIPHAAEQLSPSATAKTEIAK